MSDVFVIYLDKYLKRCTLKTEKMVFASPILIFKVTSTKNNYF